MQSIGARGGSRSCLRLLVRAVAALSIAGIAVVAPTQLPAATAATTSLTTATSVTALADTVALADYPAGSNTVVIAQNSTTSVPIGASVASRLGAAMLVAANGTSASAELPQLSALGTTKVILVSDTPSWFNSAYRSTVTGTGITIKTTYGQTGILERSDSAASEVSGATRFVVAHTGYPDELGLAISLSSAIKIPLILWNSSTTSSAMDSFVDSHAAQELFFVAPESIVPFHLMVESQMPRVHRVTGTDYRQTQAWITTFAQTAGVITNSFVAAPSNSAQSQALAGLTASKKNTLMVQAGTPSAITTNSRATEMLDFWRAESTDVRLLGIGLTSANLTALTAPTNVARPAAPAFRIVNTELVGSAYKYTFTAVTGATSYVAYDTAGATLGTSSTSVITLPAQANGLLIVAKSGSTELSRLDVRMNSYDNSASRRSLVVGSTAGGVNHLVFLSGVKLPRLITRTVADPFDMDPSPSAAVPIAITCNAIFTDTGLDSTKQYAYNVQELTNVPAKSCNSAISATPASATSLIASQVPFPATTFPWAVRDENTDTQLKASPTIIGMMVEKAIDVTQPTPMARNVVPDEVVEATPDDVDGDEEGGLEAAPTPTYDAGTSTEDTKLPSSEPLRPNDESLSSEQNIEDATDAPIADAAASSYAIFFRWMAYIPEGKVFYPAFSGDPARPFSYFSGDDRTIPDPSGSSRFTQTIRMHFSSSPYVVYEETMGETKLFHCSGFATGCQQVAAATAPLTQLSQGPTWINPAAGVSGGTASATIPLLSTAPAIDVQWRVEARSSGVYLSGYHDNMPKHQFIFGPYPGQAYLGYSSPYVGYGQLPCLFASPTNYLPGCSINFNVQL